MAGPELQFEWDDRKEALNQRKHKVAFEEARTWCATAIAKAPKWSESSPPERPTGLSVRSTNGD